MKNVSKLLSVLLCLAMVVGIFAMTVSADPVTSITYDFTGKTTTGTSEITSNVKQFMESYSNHDYLAVASFSKVYNGNSNGGAFQGVNFLKLGTSSANGTITLTYDATVKVTKVEILCHSWKDNENNSISVNSGTAQATSKTGTMTNLIFNLTDNSNVVTINFAKRGFISKIVVHAESTGFVTPSIPATAITIPETLKVVNGTEYKLNATVTPAETTDSISWTSSDPSVATVDADGLIKALKIGTTTITATAGSVSDTCTLTVAASSAIEDGLYVIWNPGNNKALSANPSKDGSYYNGGIDVTFADNKLTGYGDTEVWVVTNNSDGTITIATQDGKKFSMDTDFASTPFDKANDKWVLGDASENQFYIINIGRGNQYLQWRAGSSYNYFSCYTTPSVESYGFTFTKHNVAVTGVTLDKTTQNLTVGGSVDLVATVAPSNATNQDVTWTSSNTAVATVANGKVTAVAAGTATITVTTADGSKTATCTITVVAATVPATGVTLDKTTASLEVGKDVTLSATVAPADSTDAVVWSTSDATIATVAGGKVTALKAGTVTITAKAGDKTATCTVTITAPVVEEEEKDDNTTSTTPSKPAVSTWTVQSTPKTGTAFKFGMNQKGLGKQLWFTGEMDGYYLATSDDVKNAVDVVVEAVEGGYRLSFTKDGVKKYIDIVERTDKAGSANVVITDTPTAVLTWDATAKTFFAKAGEETFYLGTYGTYKTFSASKTSYITGDNASKVDESQYVSHLYLDTASSTGDAFEPMVIVLALAAVSALAVLALNKKKFSF